MNHFDGLDKRIREITRRAEFGKFPFTLGDYRKLLQVCHPDSPASKEIREEVARMVIDRAGSRPEQDD
jgi:hypothetical protein